VGNTHLSFFLCSSFTPSELGTWSTRQPSTKAVRKTIIIYLSSPLTFMAAATNPARIIISFVTNRLKTHAENACIKSRAWHMARCLFTRGPASYIRSHAWAYAVGQVKPLSLFHSHERAGQRSSIPPTFVRQGRPKQGFSPPAQRLFEQAAAFNTCYSPAVLSTDRRPEQQPQLKRRF